MAEGLLKHMLPKGLQARVQVASAGTHALHGHPAAGHGIAVMRAHGIDIGAHRARLLSRETIRSADLVLVMERAHLEWIRMGMGRGGTEIRPIGEIAGAGAPEDVPAPYGEDRRAYRDCAERLKKSVAGVIGYLQTRLGPENP